MGENQFPVDLARVVHKDLVKRRSGVPALRVLQNLFETMYFVSLKREEGEPIVLSLILLDPENPDPEPPKRIRADRWRSVAFEEQIPLNVPNLVKLAKASDPRTSALAVWHNPEAGCFIWGMVDQGRRYHAYINYESESGPPRLGGIFQTSITGAGHITVAVGYEKIAELRTNTLLGRTLDVLRAGPVHTALRTGISQHVQAVREKVLDEIYDDRNHWDDTLERQWVDSLRRLLLRIQSFRHGGAVLITPDTQFRGLSLKYEVTYERLWSSLVEIGISKILHTHIEDMIYDQWADQMNIVSRGKIAKGKPALVIRQEGRRKVKSVKVPLPVGEFSNLFEQVPATDFEDVRKRQERLIREIAQNSESGNSPLVIPWYLHTEQDLWGDTMENVRSALDGAIWFISLLSRVDGLILMDPALVVHGFGVEITISEDPPELYLAKTVEAPATDLEKINLNHYGTRHRSMMRYCWRIQGSIGFVISQDGDVRVITRVDDKLVMWDNIKLRYLREAIPRRRKARPTQAPSRKREPKTN